MAIRQAALDVETLSRLGTALGDATRRHILLHLLDGPSYPAEIADALHTSRANVSNHLACLRGCGMVTMTPEGRRVRYEVISPELAERLRAVLAVVGPEDPSHAHLGQPG